MGIAISCACDQVLIAAWGCLCGDGNYMHTMNTNLEALRNSMQELEEKREDLLRRVKREEDKGFQSLARVKGWLSRVEGVGPQVSDLLDESTTETGRLCMFGYCSGNCISSCKYGERVSKKLEEIKGLLSQDFEVVADVIPALKILKRNLQVTVGMDASVKEAWDRLMKRELRVLGLYGMGGVGKTTLLACINNKFFEFEKEIDIVIWVVVSKDMQNKCIQDQILGRLRVDNEWNNATEEQKASLIYNNLVRKKFVLLLDDLWSEVDLNKIGVPPVTQVNRSKIVLTTRSKEVCKNMEVDDMMKVLCLPPKEAWELFMKNVGNNPLKSRRDIIPVAREIAEKCCGLPLALCVIGKAMACKETEQGWYHAIDVLNSNSHKFPNMEDKVLSILKFSYDSLKDAELKLCFLYCSLFPEDHEIEKEELIQYWICEGVIDRDGDEDGVYNKGHDIIGSLLCLQLMMEGYLSSRVKLHDMMREMALWIATTFGKQKDILCVKSGAQLSQIPNDIHWETVMKISLMRNQIERISGSFKCPNLSTLFLHNNKFDGIPGHFFQFMTSLVVLNLSMNFKLSRLPEEMSSLVSLQYLNLSYTPIQSLPVCLKKLKKLINLNLECTLNLQSIAGIATSLPKLQVLRFMSSNVVIDGSLMEELQGLKHLNYLTATVNDALILEGIERSARLATSLRGLCLRGIVSQVLVLNTIALNGLQRFEIIGCAFQKITVVFDGEAQGFKNLSRVHVIGLVGPRELTWLLFAQNLTYLLLSNSPQIEEIINEELRMSITTVQPDIAEPFEKLEFIHLQSLDKLERICLNRPSFPNLRQFTNISCPELSEAATEFPGVIGVS